jgi:glycosyltransferase involved in cell wall biosynthesis
MKVLFISAFAPLPDTNGSKIRAAGFLKSLQKQDVYLLMIRHPSEKADTKSLRRITRHVWDFTHPPITRKDKFLNIFSMRPWLADKYFSLRIKQTIREIIKKYGIDIVVAETLLCAEYIHDLSGVYTVMDEHNLEFIRAGRRLPLRKNPFSFLRDYLIYLRLKRYEIHVLRKINRTIVCSSTDRDILAALSPGLCISVVPNTVDTEYFTPVPSGNIEPVMMFTGTLWYEPNADAVKVLARDIIPKLEPEFPEVKLYIVGDKKGVNLSAYENNKKLVFTGEVTDIRLYFRRSSIFLAPIRMGSGTRLKILAAMAMGLPVVSTRIGCEGLDVTDGENICLAEKAEDFQAVVSRLLNDPEFFRKIAGRGRKLVETYYSSKVSLNILTKVWEGIEQSEGG